jgi:CheY-like chemotaxis protein
MPILNGFEATKHIRAHEKYNPLGARPSQPRLPEELNDRIPTFAVSASLCEAQWEDMVTRGMDGWMLKPIDFKRLRMILRGINGFITLMTIQMHGPLNRNKGPPSTAI